MIIAGTDEAGRGPVIGPMVMAIATIDDSDEHKLKELGVKDSKLLTPKQRNFMFDKLKDILKEYKIIILTPQDIDYALNSDELNLNWLEAITSVKLIHNVKCDKVILDCPSNNLDAYKDYVKKLLNKDVNLVVEHKADLNNPIVSAASILAKVTRDREIEKLKQELNLEDFGSGYPSDPKTKIFLEKNYKNYPLIFRKTWASYKRLIVEKHQKKLGEY